MHNHAHIRNFHPHRSLIKRFKRKGILVFVVTLHFQTEIKLIKVINHQICICNSGAMIFSYSKVLWPTQCDISVSVLISKDFLFLHLNRKRAKRVPLSIKEIIFSGKYNKFHFFHVKSSKFETFHKISPYNMGVIFLIVQVHLQITISVLFSIVSG